MISDAPMCICDCRTHAKPEEGRNAQCEGQRKLDKGIRLLVPIRRIVTFTLVFEGHKGPHHGRAMALRAPFNLAY